MHKLLVIILLENLTRFKCCCFKAASAILLIALVADISLECCLWLFCVIYYFTATQRTWITNNWATNILCLWSIWAPWQYSRTVALFQWASKRTHRRVIFILFQNFNVVFRLGWCEFKKVWKFLKSNFAVTVLVNSSYDLMQINICCEVSTWS
jgi:hypothetical protein